MWNTLGIHTHTHTHAHGHASARAHTQMGWFRLLIMTTQQTVEKKEKRLVYALCALPLSFKVI